MRNASGILRRMMLGMSPLELFHEAQLHNAIAAQRLIVAQASNDHAAQLLLCELLAYTGDRQAVRKQLRTIRTEDPALHDYLDGWRQILHADDTRHEGAEPSFLLDPPATIARRWPLFIQLEQEPADEILDELDTLDEATPYLSGHIDGRPFEGVRDADDLLAPILEVFHADELLWVPWEQLRKLRLCDADVLRDRLYRPAELWLVDGSHWDVIVPMLYAGTQRSEEEGILVGAGTDWVEVGPLMRGIGGKTLLFGEEELMLGEFCQVEIRNQ